MKRSIRILILLISITSFSQTRKDSTISKIAFDINDEKLENLINTSSLNDYKNKEFPNFELNTLSDKNYNSEKLKGKPTMINFWFTKCPPCIDEMPVLNKIKETYKDDFNFIAITYENEEDVKNFLKKHPFNFEHLISAQNFTDQLGVKAYPTNLFLDKDGILKYINGGIGYQLNEEGELKIGEGNEMIEIIEELK